MDVSPENLFQHTAARRRLREFGLVYAQGFQFQHTAARRRLLKIGKLSCVANNVSTHSRPKAAADCDCDGRRETMVSTHSRPKAAAPVTRQIIKLPVVSTHSRPKAAATCHACCTCYCCRFNTQPPEGGCNRVVLILGVKCSFNTQPPEGGCEKSTLAKKLYLMFQHTAARRRLLTATALIKRQKGVSTHSRPKAAALLGVSMEPEVESFNTQPPEGGC